MEKITTADYKNINPHIDQIIEACERSDLSLDFIIPLLRGKDEAVVQETIKHMHSYASRIEALSQL